MSSYLTLLSPTVLSWKNELSRRGRHTWPRRLILALLAGALWLGAYWIARRVLFYFQSVHGLGPALAFQLLLIILLTFFSMLLFSNLITALSAFFLAHDLPLLRSTPTAAGDFFAARLTNTAVNSSWMVLFFTLPILAAYAAVFRGGALFYLSAALVLPLFLIIPAALGVLVIHLLVYCLPARRIRDVLFFIGLFAFIILYVLFRVARPEQLVQPESFGFFLQYLSAMETPSSSYLPSSWSAEILGAFLFQRPTDLWFFYPLLLSYALFLPWVGSWVSSLVHLAAWSKAQESRQGRRKDRVVEWMIDLATRPFPATARAIAVKDVKTFLRDTTQWSQLFLLVALMVVYIYNFKVLPLDRSPIPAATLRAAVAFVNLGLAGFVLSAVAVRFAFPAVSLEGRALWILQASPIALRSALWSKFWLNLAPLVFLGELLIFLSNRLLRVPDWMMALSLVTVFMMTFGVAAINVGVGAMHPKFDYDHAAQIPTSFGGLAAMIASVGFVGLCTLVEAWPVYQLAAHALKPEIAQPSLWILVPSVAVVAALTVTAVAVSITLGLKSLDSMRD
jgi:ABC-2 type transport system permease protein